MIFNGRTHVFFRAYNAALIGRSADPDATPEIARDLAKRAGDLADTRFKNAAEQHAKFEIYLAALAGYSAQVTQSPEAADGLAAQAAELATS